MRKLRTIRLGKRAGGWLPPVKESIVIIVAVIIIAFFFGFLLFGGSAKKEADIKEKADDIRQAQALVDLMRSQIRVVMPGAEGESWIEDDFAGLMTKMDAEKDSKIKESQRKALEEAAKQALDQMYGQNSWKIIMINKENKEIEIGKISFTNIFRQTKSIEMKIPSYRNELITVFLVVLE